MKKILVVTNHSYMLYRFRKELMEQLVQRYQVVISTPFVGHEEDLEKLGCRCIHTDVDRRGMNPKRDAILIRDYARLLKQEAPDGVITYSIKPNIYMGMLCRLKKISYVVNVQGLGTAFESKKLAAVVTVLYREALKRARRVFFENRSDAGEFIRRSIIPRKKATILPGAGINLKEFAYQPIPRGEQMHFLYLGRIMKEKGIDEWLEACIRLKQEYGERVVFDMVGFFEDSYKERIESLVQQGVVVFHGFQSEPRPFYEMASCIVMPSYHEGLSNVLLEAAAMGRPVVTSDVAGCRETVVDGVTGFLCPVRDAELLHERMKRVVEMPTDQLEEMGRQGRRYIADNFAKDLVVEQTLHAIGHPGAAEELDEEMYGA